MIPNWVDLFYAHKWIKIALKARKLRQIGVKTNKNSA